MPDFDRDILATLESAFAPDEIELLMFMPDSGDLSYAIKLIHKSSGIEVVKSEYDSQIKNKAAGLADLLAKLRDS